MQGVVRCFNYLLLHHEELVLTPCCLFDVFDEVPTDTLLTGAPGTPSGETGGELQYLPLHGAEKYISFLMSKIDGRQIAIMLSCEEVFTCTGYEGPVTALRLG